MRVLLKGTDKANLYCDWSSVQSIANNQSTITLLLVIEPLTSIGSWTDFNGSYLGTEDMTFNGTIPNISKEEIIATKKMTVNHEADGTKKQVIKWKWGVNSPWGGFENPSGSFTIALPTIARATVPTVDVTSLYIGEKIVIQTPKASSTFKHTLKYKLGGEIGEIATDVSNQKTWTLPLNLCNLLPDDISGTMRIYCETYNGAEKIGTKYIDVSVKVPKDIIPTVSTISTKEQETTNTLGVFVKNISKISVDIKAVGAYGSTIKTITTTFNGTIYKGKSFSLGLLKKSGTLTVKIIDSRGRTATATKDIDCIDYRIPNIKAFDVERCNADGTLNSQGEYVKIAYDYSISPINDLNDKIIVIAYKQGNGAYTNLLTLNDYAKSGTYIPTETFDIDLSFDFKIELDDSFNENIQNFLLSSDSDTIIDIKANGKSIGIGCVAEEDETVTLAWDIKQKKDKEFIDISLSSTFKAYDEEQMPQYRVKANIVEIRGAISPITAFMGSATMVTFGNIPTQYAPDKPIYILCQGSEKNTWLLTVSNTGELQVSRYGGTAYEQVETTSWLTFHVTYTI